MSVWYVVRDGLSGFSRAKLAAAGSVITVTIALLLLGLYFIASNNLSRVVAGLKEKVEMEAFLREPVSPAGIAEIQKNINAVEGVERIQFVSKEEAARVFKQEFGEDVGTVLNFNPLPPSFKIYLKEPFRTTSKAELVSGAIRGIKGVDEVVYRREMLEFIEKQARVLDGVGLGIGLILGISAVFLVSNTIRLTIYAKRKAIQTMKLVGASRWFVRAPFIIEGLLQGLAGGIAAAGIIAYLLSSVVPQLSADLSAAILVDPSFYLLVPAAGMVLGLFGSTVSVHKYIGETVST